mgnify:CR=1 FL=1
MTELLDRIQDSSDVKRLNLAGMEKLCDEICLMARSLLVRLSAGATAAVGQSV